MSALQGRQGVGLGMVVIEDSKRGTIKVKVNRPSVIFVILISTDRE